MSDRGFRRLSPLTPVARSGILLVVALGVMARNLAEGGGWKQVGPIAVGLPLLLVAGAAWGVVSWARTKFWIGPRELRIDTGVVNRQSRRLRIDRLQGVDIVQPFAARLLGLAELRMDVAGGKASEGSLAYLRLADAHELKDMLLARRDSLRDRRPADSPEAEHQATSEVSDAAREPRELARVDVATLMGGLLLSGITGWLVVILVGLGVASWATGGAAAVGFAPALPVLIGLGATWAKRFTGYYGFTVTDTETGLQVRRGLFDLSSQTLALRRLQGLVVSEPLPWRLVGWARLDVAIAGGATSTDRSEGPTDSVALPVGPRAEVLRLARHVLGEADPEQTVLTGPPRRAGWAAPVSCRFVAAGLGERLVVTRQGWLTRRTHVVPHARTQSLRLEQGPWLRVLGLADLVVDSPPGVVAARAAYRDAGEARRMLEQEADRGRRARAVGTAGPGGVEWSGGRPWASSPDSSAYRP